MSSEFWRVGTVTEFLKITSQSVSFSPLPSPAGPSGRFTITAGFETGSTGLCGVRFLVTELTVDGKSGVDRLETGTIASTGQQVQGFSEQTLGHPPLNFAPFAQQDLTFTVDLGSRRPFGFLVDAWGTLQRPGQSCD